MNKSFCINLIFAIMSLLFCGCHSSSKVIAEHFDNLNEIAEKNSANCEQMASALNQYLSVNEVTFRKAVADVSNAEPDEAQRIFSASLKLHEASKACQNSEIEEFKAKLSDIVLQEAVND
jgi:hypothetical protein